MSDFRIYLDFTKAAEGGLSKAKTDSASHDPVPDGSGYHTNKGITWTTFKTYAPRLGYVATPELFYKMPEWIFLGIYQGFWNASGAGRINSQVIAQLVFQALWGGGHESLVADIQRFLAARGYHVFVDGELGPQTAGAINDFTRTKAGEKSLYEYTYTERLKYLRSLPSYPDNKGGWESRMNKLYQFSLDLMAKHGNAIATVMFVTGSFFFNQVYSQALS